ncbi:MAG TPA: sugar ABC transporter permease, partial [Chloroflexota bacterium]|nr:sugar ABC transporter permease [Chloroflexota bacterium]
MTTAARSLVGERRALPWYAKLVGAESPLDVSQAIYGYIFLIPWILGLIIFIVGPIIACFYFSFTDFEGMGTPHFVGLANYVKAFTSDDLFWPSVGRTFEYSIIVVPVGLVASLFLAVMLNRAVKGISVFRTFFFVPTLTPAVALAILWAWLFHPSVGPINLALKWIGIQGPEWLQSAQWALPAIVIINLWASVGGNTMIIFLAGLQGVPQEMIEAAEIDGAGRWAKFRHITLPMISPTFLFNLILGIIG